jgi:hypothetical protein
VKFEALYNFDTRKIKCVINYGTTKGVSKIGIHTVEEFFHNLKK